MTTIEYVRDWVIPSALSFLPAKMDSLEARTELLAISLQESGLKYRRQVGGPARGLWQFEQGGGVRGVLDHVQTKPIIIPLLKVLCYEPSPSECHLALADNDILACVFARLLLWTHPLPLPRQDQPAAGWDYYVSLWRPGKPRPDAWNTNFSAAITTLALGRGE